jgi:hypothetical protein
MKRSIVSKVPARTAGRDRHAGGSQAGRVGGRHRRVRLAQPLVRQWQAWAWPLVSLAALAAVALLADAVASAGAWTPLVAMV